MDREQRQFILNEALKSAADLYAALVMLGYTQRAQTALDEMRWLQSQGAKP